MNLKEELCKHLIDNNLVEEFDVIKHNYSTSKMNDWEKRNVETNNISPTLDTRCDCLGVVVKDDDIYTEESKKRIINNIVKTMVLGDYSKGILDIVNKTLGSDNNEYN